MKETPFGPLAAPGTHGPDAGSYWVVHRRLAAGPYPYSHNPLEGIGVIDRLVAAGLTAFVDLTDPKTTDGHLAPYAETLRHAAPGASVVSHPIRDLHVPSVNEMQSALDSIDRQLGESQAVYVHCWGGIGRTGTVVGCWLIRHEVVEPPDALETIARLRLGIPGSQGRPSPETDEQRRFIESWKPGA